MSATVWRVRRPTDKIWDEPTNEGQKKEHSNMIGCGYCSAFSHSFSLLSLISAALILSWPATSSIGERKNKLVNSMRLFFITHFWASIRSMSHASPSAINISETHFVCSIRYSIRKHVLVHVFDLIYETCFDFHRNAHSIVCIGVSVCVGLPLRLCVCVQPLNKIYDGSIGWLLRTVHSTHIQLTIGSHPHSHSN